MPCFFKKAWRYHPAFLLLLILPSPVIVYAWNAKGHVQISQIAFNQLSEKEKMHINDYAEYLRSKLHETLQMQLDDSYKGAALFSKLSTLPDRWRNMTVEALFDQFDAPLPKVLYTYRNDTTNTWHFEDHSYPTKRLCHQENIQHLNFAITKLTQAWQQTNHEESKAVILILITHFIEDAHQPLHMLSKTTKRCQNDAGGNKHTLYVGRHKKINLHQLWDSGVGYLNHSANYQARATNLEMTFPMTFFGKTLFCQDPEFWSTESYHYAKFIYTAQKNKPVKPKYYQKGQAIARQQMVLAGYRLSLWIKKFMHS